MRKKKCLLLLHHNKNNEFYIKKIGEISKNKKFTLVVGYDQKNIDKNIDFVFCIDYPKIISPKYIELVKKGIYVFHSSDLPEGKGWAPIYHSIMNQKKKNHVMTTIKINEKVDAGEIIVKTYFKKREGENADSLKEVDKIMTIKTIQRIIDDLLSFELKGQRQKGKGSYYKRRTLADSEVDVKDSLENIHYHCLAVAKEHPAFYFYKNKKYIVSIRPESLEEFSEHDIKIISFYKKL